ncbi:MAG TPA: DUF302 domain-containing protein [Actinomycetota bacterium]|nr:DUF302 domain-containing protein [Actinomycetota bacterium]
MTDYGYSVEVEEGYDEAVIRTRMALRSEGFSILTEMNVGGLLGPESGPERQYLIMGVYNSAIAHRQLEPDLQMAVHLPCNFVVRETGDSALVAALDPRDAADESQISEALIAEASDALGRVLQKVVSPL